MTRIQGTFITLLDDVTSETRSTVWNHLKVHVLAIGKEWGNPASIRLETEGGGKLLGHVWQPSLWGKDFWFPKVKVNPYLAIVKSRGFGRMEIFIC